MYLDYNATTPLDPAVREAVLTGLDLAWGNPSSIHHVGRHARALLDDARDRIAVVLGCKPSELVFTSGGTEANNLAIFGTVRPLARTRPPHLICSPTEHPAVLHTFHHLARQEACSLTLLPVDAAGRVDPASVAAALRPDTALVSVMTANNETGVLQPVSEIGRLCRQHGIPFHTDAVQSFGKLPWHGLEALEADLVTLCAHKLHGPRGAGLLYCRSPRSLEPQLLGGAHEYERRAGTENLPAILGMAEAIERFVPDPVFNPSRLGPLSSRLAAALRPLPGVTLHTPPGAALANTLAFTVEGTDSLALLAAMDLVGICASSGSACSVGSLEPSHVLLAMGVPRPRAAALVRFSLGRDTTATDIDSVAAVLPSILAQATAQ
ncbi:MAG: cysteine desulfurase [Verrucomicrobiae bacterium]|nr:cysteine desulfurase [Verrucomicrobiae bacterium]